MGINSTGTAYNFGQLGSGFSDEAVEVTPPTGKVIVAITFLEAAVLSTLVAATDGLTKADGSEGDVSFSHTTAVAANGGGAAESDGATSFPAGLTIYGRWSSFTPPASDAGGVIFYFGY
jgi:hypothetical protein|tara:strand:+ start:112 stop:468 length:357 start_codon:yes stop_codon:yes gene_type:complete